MKRKILGVLAGLAAWTVIAIIGAVIMRSTWPEYVAAADSMEFTLPMKIARLSLGAIATLGAGWATAFITRRSTIPILMPGIVLLALFIPQHVTLWDKFPLWYHLTFLLTLVPLSYLGGRLPGPQLPQEGLVTASTL